MNLSELLQVAGFALVCLTIVYKAGKIEQKLDDMIKRMSKVEEKQDLQETELGRNSASIARIQGHLGVEYNR